LFSVSCDISAYYVVLVNICFCCCYASLGFSANQDNYCINSKLRHLYPTIINVTSVRNSRLCWCYVVVLKYKETGKYSTELNNLVTKYFDVIQINSGWDIFCLFLINKNLWKRKVFATMTNRIWFYIVID
jgi:hypothetical protein